MGPGPSADGLLAYEYTYDLSTGSYRQVSDLGGANLHFIRYGHYYDNYTAFAPIWTSIVEGSSSGGGWLPVAGVLNGGIGVLAGGVENLSGKLSVGSNFKPYSSRWGGNQYVSTVKAAKVGKILGYGTLGLGTVIDGVGVGYYYLDGKNNLNAVHPAKAGLNLGVGAWSLLSPANAIGGVMYFGIDSFYPGGFIGAMQYNATLQWQNQQVLGPSFNLYRDW